MGPLGGSDHVNACISARASASPLRVRRASVQIKKVQHASVCTFKTPPCHQFFQPTSQQGWEQDWEASSQSQQRTVDGKLGGQELERRHSRKKVAPYHGERETAKGVGDRQRGRKIQSKTRTQYKQSPAHQAIRQGRTQTSSEGEGSRQQKTK